MNDINSDNSNTESPLQQATRSIRNHPDDGPLYNWTISEMLTRIITGEHISHEEDDYQVVNYIQEADPNTMYAIFAAVDQESAEYAQDVSEFTMELTDRIIQRIQGIVDGNEKLPEIITEDDNITERFMTRPTVTTDLMSLLPPARAQEIKEALLTQRNPAAADQAARELVATYQGRLRPVLEEMAWEIASHLTQPTRIT